MKLGVREECNKKVMLSCILLLPLELELGQVTGGGVVQEAFLARSCMAGRIEGEGQLESKGYLAAG